MAGVILVVGVTVLLSIGGGAARRTAERRLYDRLLRDYDPGSRPVLSANDSVTVNFSVGLHTIMDLVEKNQTLITQVWVYEEWQDEMLTWKPKKYGNIRHMVLPAMRVWLPDIYIFNKFHSLCTGSAKKDAYFFADKGYQGFININESRLMADHTGHVQWVIPLIIKSSCAVDVTYFPFDNQKCFVRFGSWIYEESQLNLVTGSAQVNLSAFIPNNEMHLDHIELQRKVMEYDVFPGKYPQITMHMHLRRKSVYYAYTVIAPTLVLCILTLFSFLLPCDNGDKVGIGLTVFLSLYVLQLAITENIPESNSLPLIGLFLTLVMTLNAISLVFATLVINIKKKGDYRNCPAVPDFVLSFCKKILARMTCTPFFSMYEFYGYCEGDMAVREGTVHHSNDDIIRNVAGGAIAEDIGACALSTGETAEMIQLKQRRYSKLQGEEGTSKGLSVSNGSSYNQVPGYDIDNQPRDPRYEWFFVAEVLDKSLFFVFLIGLVVTVSTSLLIIPYIHRND